MISLIWYAYLYLSSLYLSIYMCIYVINYTYTYLSIHIHMSIVPNLYYFLNFFVIQLSFFLYLCKTSSLISSSFFHILLIYLFTYLFLGFQLYLRQDNRPPARTGCAELNPKPQALQGRFWQVCWFD